jgi:chemotaxis protein methyltransferase CheR
MDLILCRNVLIYFDKPTIARVAHGLHATLADGGWLVTGPSDPPLDALAPLEPVVTPAGVFYRKAVRRWHRATPTEAASEQRPPVSEPTEPEQSPVPAPACPAAPRAADSPRRSVEALDADPLADARQALAAGEYERALQLTPAGDPAAAALHIRARANAHGSEDAERWARHAIARHPFAIELHLLHALLLVDMRRHADAEQALRRVLYLDRSLAIAHYLLGATLRDQGKLDAARHAYRQARDLARARPPDEALPFADGEPAARLAASADAELARLETREQAS